ncbi:hypothetical protein F5Y12DRAFT_323946 [Xylaria sp. FL1777]|nr:hypothetical protein F5Y12DRAFT_323946 [Xylaria sp. FL1777]
MHVVHLLVLLVEVSVSSGGGVASTYISSRSLLSSQQRLSMEHLWIVLTFALVIFGGNGQGELSHTGVSHPALKMENRYRQAKSCSSKDLYTVIVS